MNLLNKNFNEWTRGRDALQARINVFEKIRDIPYAIIPEIIEYKRYTDILKLGRVSCSPKHFLMCEMFRRLGLQVLYVVYPHSWGERADLLGKYKEDLKRKALQLHISHHIACKVEVDGKLVLVDATLDPPLQKIGLPVNLHWDGRSDTILPMTPCGEEELYHPSEAPLMRADVSEEMLAFYAEVNEFFKRVRHMS